MLNADVAVLKTPNSLLRQVLKFTLKWKNSHQLTDHEKSSQKLKYDHQNPERVDLIVLKTLNVLGYVYRVKDYMGTQLTGTANKLEITVIEQKTIKPSEMLK